MLGAAALGKDAGVLPSLPLATIAYAALEDLTAAAFVAAARHRRGATPVPAWLIAALAVAIGSVALDSTQSVPFLDVYRLHAVLAEDVETPVRISWGVAAFGDGTPFADAMIAADGRLYDRRSVRRG